jgi:nucleoside-diphosphate-sugar epimerase
MPHRALVTGATGFIGSHLLETLVSKNVGGHLPLETKQSNGLFRPFSPRTALRGNSNALPRIRIRTDKAKGRKSCTRCLG